MRKNDKILVGYLAAEREATKSEMELFLMNEFGVHAYRTKKLVRDFIRDNCTTSYGTAKSILNPGKLVFMLRHNIFHPYQGWASTSDPLILDSFRRQYGNPALP